MIRAPPENSRKRGMTSVVVGRSVDTSAVSHCRRCCTWDVRCAICDLHNIGDMLLRLHHSTCPPSMPPLSILRQPPNPRRDSYWVSWWFDFPEDLRMAAKVNVKLLMVSSFGASALVKARPTHQARGTAWQPRLLFEGGAGSLVVLSDRPSKG